MTSIRRALDLPGRAATSVGAALLAVLAPKCPMCVAAYLAGLGLGAGASHSAAPFVRPVALLVASVAGLALVRGVWRRYRRRAAPGCCLGAGLDRGG